MDIIGYIHVCQKGEWQRSFSMLIQRIVESGLYNHTKVIRIGVVNDSGILVEDTILEDPKFEIVYVGKSDEYERATLHHMRMFSEIDPENTKYYYLHTKGLKHFGTEREQNVIDWIQLMLYWNIEKWCSAIQVLDGSEHETYGCNVAGHYSGNFWWAKPSHIRKLPRTIGPTYFDPEDWIACLNVNLYSAYNSGLQGMGHYDYPFPRELYAGK
jgi:hypothetical protein